MKAGNTNHQAFTWLAGHWSFRRDISNGLSATGQAQFLRRAPGVLDYGEQGALSNGAQFTKRYRYSLGADGITVVHADPQNDGAAFQTLEFANVPNANGDALSAQASNLCGDDWYDSIYRLGRDRIWMAHTVKGPKKDYRIETAFQRLIASADETP